MDIQRVIDADPSMLERVRAYCEKHPDESEESVLEMAVNRAGLAAHYRQSQVFSFKNYKEWMAMRYETGVQKYRKVKVLYVYGYSGSHTSRTVGKLKQHLPADRFEVLCYDYPQRDCAAALRFLKDKIKKHHVDIVMGSSLGAFIALGLDVDIPKIIVNPCLIPSVELPKLPDNAPSKALVDSYAPFEDVIFGHVTSGSRCFMAPGDELLGNTYRKPMEEHMPVTSIPGGHRLADEAMPQIVAAIQAMAQEKLEQELLTSFKQGWHYKFSQAPTKR